MNCPKMYHRSICKLYIALGILSKDSMKIKLYQKLHDGVSAAQITHTCV